MILKLDSENEVVFTRGGNCGKLWWANMWIRDLQIELSFDETIFGGKSNNNEVRSYERLIFVIKRIVSQLEECKGKAVRVLEVFYNEIFTRKLKPDEVYFGLTGIYITSIKQHAIVDNCFNYDYELVFSLESEVDDLLDMHYQYKAKFESISHDTVILASVTREKG